MTKKAAKGITFGLAITALTAVSGSGCGNGFDKVYVVEYARSTGVPGDRLLAGVPATELLDMSWNFLVIVRQGRVILLDAGSTYFEKEAAPNFFKTYWKTTWHRSVQESLQSINILPEQVNEVWITHKHWDHFEGIRDLPNAKVLIQGSEWDDAKTEYTADPTISLGWVPSIVPVMNDIEAQGRLVRLTPENAKAYEGYPMWLQDSGAILEGGKHTSHSTVFAVKCTNGKKYYLAGDAAYTYRNMIEHRAVGLTVDAAANVRDVTKLVEVAGGIDNVIPGHDPSVFTKFGAAPGAHVAKICDN